MQALETSRQEEVLIRLPSGGLLAAVEEQVNGITVKSERIRTDELIFSLMKMLDEADIRSFLLQQGYKDFSLLEIFGPMISESNSVHELDRVFELFLKRFGSEGDRDIMIRLFTTFAEHIDLASLHENSVNKMLKTILAQVKQIHDSRILKELLVTMLEKVSISEEENFFINKVYKALLDGMNRENNEDLLQEMFGTLTGRIRQEWILKYLSPYLERFRLSSPLLPRNCLLYQETGRRCRVVAIEVEKQQFNVQFGTTMYEKVGYPRLLFVFTVYPDNQITAQVLTVKDKIIGPETAVFYYPYSNVEQSGLSMRACWPELKDLAKERDIYNNLDLLSSFPYLFLNSPSNNDLYRYENLRDRFILYSGREFDDSILEPTGKTIADMLHIANPVLDESTDDDDEEDYLDVGYKEEIA